MKLIGVTYIHIEGLTRYTYSSQYVLKRVLFYKCLYSEGWLQALLRLCCSIRGSRAVWWDQGGAGRPDRWLSIFCPSSRGFPQAHPQCPGRDATGLLQARGVISWHQLVKSWLPFLNFPVARVLMGDFARPQKESKPTCLYNSLRRQFSIHRWKQQHDVTPSVHYLAFSL